jgi:hypothetical protein
MNLGARLGRLERRAAGVLRCAWCRYSLVNVGDGGGRGKGEGEPPADFVWRVCRWCGNRYRLLLPDLPAREREALLLWYHTFDGETYTDERAYAAQRWWGFRWSKLALEEEVDDDKPAARPAANPAYRGGYGRGRQERPKESRAAREQRELKEAAQALLRKARAREERLYGPRAFPLVKTLKELEEDCGHYAHLYDKGEGHQARSPAEIKARQLLAYARRMEACELVLWGEAGEETARALATLPVEVERLAEERRAEHREKQERERREREEREERRREERERQHRPAAIPPVPTEPARVPDSIADVIERHTGFRPGTEGVPAAGARVSVSVPTDREGRPLIVIPKIPPPPPDVSRLPGHRRYYRGPHYEGDKRY